MDLVPRRDDAAHMSLTPTRQSMLSNPMTRPPRYSFGCLIQSDLRDLAR